MIQRSKSKSKSSAAVAFNTKSSKKSSKSKKSNTKSSKNETNSNENTNKKSKSDKPEQQLNENDTIILTYYVADYDLTELRLHFGEYINIIKEKENGNDSYSIECCHYMIEDVLFHGRVTEQQIFDLFFQRVYNDIKV